MEVKKIAVIGSGTMGRGIAYTAALSGFEVTLQDISAEALDKAKDYNGITCKFKVLKKDISQVNNVTLFQQNVTYTTDLKEAVQSADLVIEAILEIMELKIETFKKLEEFAPAHAILATNTSTMSPTEIACCNEETRTICCDALLQSCSSNEIN